MMDPHEFRLKMMLREMLAIQLYESGIRANVTAEQDAPSWLEMPQPERNIWRTRGFLLVDSEISRCG